MIEQILNKGTTDGTNYCSSVLLRKGETAEGWSEITQKEYDEIIEEAENDIIE
jgi:hypothetical protein